jgi:RNA polymerase sigma-70 factor (ECF subfamily)
MTDAIIESLWQTYRTPLLYFIRSRVANNDEAEDLLQEVFLRVHRHLCCADDWQRPQAWFYQIARNLIVDHYRSTRELAEITDNLPAADADMDQTADEFETQLSIALKETVLELPEPYREALLRTEYDGLSNQQLADQMGISLSGAKSRVLRARQKLRELLLACCHFELDRRGRVLDYYPHCTSCATSAN